MVVVIHTFKHSNPFSTISVFTRDGIRILVTCKMARPDRKKFYYLCAALLISILLISSEAWAQQLPMLPTLKIGVEQANEPEQVSVLLQILFLLTILSLAPAIVVMMTSFTS